MGKLKMPVAKQPERIGVVELAKSIPADGVKALKP